MADLYNMVDAYTDQDAEIQSLQAKIADLEDRSRQNKIKFRGIPESVPSADLANFIQCLMNMLIPSL